MTVKVAWGYETITEPPQANPRAISPLDRISGDIGRLVTGHGGSFSSLQLAGASWHQTKENFMPLPGTDFWRFHTDLSIEQLIEEEWNVWRIGAFPFCYTIGFKEDAFAPHDLTLRLYQGDYRDTINPVWGMIAESAAIAKDLGNPHRFSFRFKHGNRASDSDNDVTIWRDGTQLIHYTGNVTITDPSPTRIDIHQAEIVNGGKGSANFRGHHDNCIYNDEAGAAPYNGNLDDTYVVMGHQPFADGTPADWDKEPTSSKVYYVLADFNRFDDPNPGTDDSAGGAVDKDHELIIVDKNAAGSVDFVAVYISTSSNEDGSPATTLSDGLSDAFTWKAIRTFGTIDAAGKLFPLAPGGGAWTNAKFDDLRIRLEGAYGTRQLCVEALGPNLAQPAETPAPPVAGFPHSQAVII